MRASLVSPTSLSMRCCCFSADTQTRVLCLQIESSASIFLDNTITRESSSQIEPFHIKPSVTIHAIFCR